MRSRRTIQAVLTAFGFLIACYIVLWIGILVVVFRTRGVAGGPTWDLVYYGSVAIVSLLLLVSLV